MNANNIFFPILYTVLIFGFYGPITANAQTSDKKEVEKVIENYIIGWRTANKDLLTKAFDLKAGVVLWVDKKVKPEQLKSMKLAALTDRVKRQEGYGIGYTIQNLQIIDSQLAMAFVKIPIKDNHYIDCLELQKINGEWKIVLKSFVFFRKE